MKVYDPPEALPACWASPRVSYFCVVLSANFTSYWIPVLPLHPHPISTALLSARGVWPASQRSVIGRIHGDREGTLAAGPVGR